MAGCNLSEITGTCTVPFKETLPENQNFSLHVPSLKKI